MNRYSYEFIAHELVRAQTLRRKAGRLSPKVASVLESMKTHFRMDLPLIRRGKAGQPGYDEVTSRTHNPFAMRAVFERLGFRDVRLQFYHFHCLPPMYERDLPTLFRRASVEMEEPSDWRGHFMASAFLLSGRRP